MPASATKRPADSEVAAPPAEEALKPHSEHTTPRQRAAAASVLDSAGNASAATPAPADAVGRARGRPRKTRTDLDEGNRRRQIIDSAARLFRSKGFDAASTRDIAAGAGMRSGSPFYHFENKHALLYVVMQEGMAHALTSQRAALAQLASGATPRVQLHTLVRNHFEVLLGSHADFTPVMLYEWRSLDAEQSKDIAALKDDYENHWMPVLQSLHASGALQATPEMARLFIFGALNWSVQWFDAHGALSLDGLTDQALALFLGAR